MRSPRLPSASKKRKASGTSESPFRIGQRVQMTAYAFENHLWTPRHGKSDGWKGTVIATRGTMGVRVLQDGYATANWYHVTFWTPLGRARRPMGSSPR